MRNRYFIDVMECTEKRRQYSSIFKIPGLAVGNHFPLMIE